MVLLFHSWFHVLNFILSACGPNFADVSSAILQRIWTAATVGGCRILSKHVFGMTEKKTTNMAYDRKWVRRLNSGTLYSLSPSSAGNLTITLFHSKNVQHSAPNCTTLRSKNVQHSAPKCTTFRSKNVQHSAPKLQTRIHVTLKSPQTHKSVITLQYSR
jgi:hypothetical protein